MLMTSPDRLSDIAIFSVFSFYGLAFYAVFLLRKNQKLDHSLYKVPLYPVTPVIAIAGAIYIIGSTVIHQPLDACLSVLITLSGIPVYWSLTAKLKNKAAEKAS
ncbi:MAG: serine/threonine protein kinase, partial [Parageobacillus thermoglucosidasius]|nr:serine/threonine protein kinase [Parageobacillus thermoglucosidasius]